MLLSEAVAMWIDQRRLENYSPHTLTCYAKQMGILIRHVGDVPVEAVTLEMLRGFFVARSRTLKPASVAHGVRMVRSFFNWCVEEEILVKSPARKLREPKLPQRIPKALPFDELERLRDACQTPREKALIEILFATGCRVSELAGINRADVDWNRRAIIVMGKGSKQREVYFGARATMRLRNYLMTRTDDHPALFITAKGSARRTTAHQVWWAVKQVGARAGMREETWPHRLRHTLGTMLLNQGAPLVAVQSILGHEKPETTQIYAQLSGSNRQQAYQRYFIQ